MATRDDTAVSRGPKSGQRLKHDDVARLVGDLEDAKIAEILAIAPTLKELEEAVAWAESESDVMGELEKSLSGAAARVYEILMTRKDFGEDERSC
jgi:hypothetical protein